MPSKWFQSFDVVAEMTRPDFHTNRIWQPHRPTLCLSPVATISLPEPVSVWTVWAWTWSIVPLDEEIKTNSIDWTNAVTDQKPRGKTQAATAAPYKQAAPWRESLYCKIKVFHAVFEMFHTQFLCGFRDSCRLFWAKFWLHTECLMNHV